MIDYFENIKKEVKNLLYLFAALSIFPNMLWLFLIYLPFIVFVIKTVSVINFWKKYYGKVNKYLNYFNNYEGGGKNKRTLHLPIANIFLKYFLLA